MAPDNRHRKDVAVLIEAVPRPALLLLLLLVLSASAQGTTAAAGDMGALDGLVGRWLALRTTLAEEQRTWEAQREQWEEELQLLQQEETALQKEVESAGSFASGVDRARATVLNRKETMTAELNRLRAVLDRAEASLRRWKAWIPPGLREPLAGSLHALPASQTAAEKIPLVKRAQTVVVLYAQIEALQQEIHATRETPDLPGGGRRLVDVLYVGLARGFAVSPGDDWAAVGEPAAEGWSWTPQPNLAPEIRHALNVRNRKKTAQMVVLPMKIATEVEP